MDENFPEKAPDAELSPSGGGSTSTARKLKVAGGEVYLPASETVKPGDEKFEKTVAEALPEIAPSLSDNALGRSRGYPVLAVLLIFGFLCAAFVAFRLCMPGPEPLKVTEVGFIEPENSTYAGRFDTEFDKAKQQIKNMQFSAARETLEPIVDTLLGEDGAKPEDAPIFCAYFSLFDRLGWEDGVRARLARLGELAPDDHRWQLFDILSHPALARRDGKFQEPNDWKLNFNAEGISAGVKKIDALRRRRPELAEQLDFCECYLELNLWRLKNHKEKSARVGVEDREEALKIAKRYGDSRDFLKIRRYIVVQMLKDSKGKFIGNYIFDGNEYYSKTRLEEELRKLKKKLDTGK